MSNARETSAHDDGGPYRRHVPVVPRPVNRHVPRALRVGVRFAGQYTQLALLLLGGVAFLLWLGARRVDWPLLGFDGPVDRYDGVVSSMDPVSTGGGRQGRPAYRVHFHYQHDGAVHSAYSMAGNDQLRPGSRVYVEVPRGHDDFAVVVGLSRPYLSHQVYFGLVGVVLVAFVALLRAQRRQGRTLRLLARGRATVAERVRCERGPFHHRRRPQWKLTHEYQDQRGQTRLVSALTNDPVLAEEAQISDVVHDPDAPDRAVLLAYLPGAPRLFGDTLHLDSAPVREAFTVIAPLLFVGANVAGALVFLLS